MIHAHAQKSRAKVICFKKIRVYVYARTAGADDSRVRNSSPQTAADRLQPGARTVDDSVIQSKLSESFSRTVQDWERVRQSRGKSQSVAATRASPPPPPAAAAAAAAERGKSRGDRDKTRARAEKELAKLAKKEQKLDEELQRLAGARLKLESQLESSSASERGGSSRAGDSSDWADDERLLAALDLLENVHDRAPSSPSVAGPLSERQSRSKSARLRRQSCMISPSTATSGTRYTAASVTKRTSVRLSVCLSVHLFVCPIIRPQPQPATGLLLSAVRAEDIDRQPGDQQRRRSTALSSKCEQCHADSRRRKLNTELFVNVISSKSSRPIYVVVRTKNVSPCVCSDSLLVARFSFCFWFLSCNCVYLLFFRCYRCWW